MRESLSLYVALIHVALLDVEAGGKCMRQGGSYVYSPRGLSLRYVTNGKADASEDPTVYA